MLQEHWCGPVGRMCRAGRVPVSVSATVVAVVLFVATAMVAKAQTIRVAATPTVRIGSSGEQSVLLNAVAGATRLPNGQIVVGNRGDYAMLVFDANGKLVKKLARKGTGPGEVDYLLWLKRCGDVVYTGDIAGNRVLEFNSALSVTRSFRFADQTYALACNSRAQFIHMGWEPPSSMKTGAFRANTKFWITPADSSKGVVLGLFPGSERFGMSNNGRPTGSAPLVLGKETRVAIGTQAAYIATADSVTVLTFNLDGSARAALRAPYTPIPSTSADIDAEIEHQVAREGEASRKSTTALFHEMPRPKMLPATRSVVVDAMDLVWVQSYPSSREATVTWTVFRPNGTVAARLSLPATLDVFEIGRDYLLGQRIDADTDVPEVHLYRVTR